MPPTVIGDEEIWARMTVGRVQRSLFDDPIIATISKENEKKNHVSHISLDLTYHTCVGAAFRF